MGVRQECELIFDGVSSKDIGITVEGYPGAFLPERDYDTETVPGRNGDLIYDYGTYKNYQQAYTIHWRYVQRDARISSWLCKPGYKRLEDSFHPEHFRIAHFNGSADIDNRMQVLKRSDVEFDFKPQWFRKAGEWPVNVSNGKTIINTGMPSKPLITVTGSGSGTLVVNDVSIALSNISNNGIVLDCDVQDAYSPDKLTNLNANITLSRNTFPEFVTGKNTIKFSGGITAVKIIPRWWDLL